MIPGSTDDQDREEMARLAAGHDPALNVLMERHAERLFHYLLRQLANPADADDLVQETFVRVYRSRERFDAGQRFSTWLYAIATNLLRDRFRWHKRHPQVSLDAESEEGRALVETLPERGGAPDERALTQERAEAVRRAVGGLPEDLRNALILVEYEGLSHAEAGEVLECSAKAVETRVYRAKAQLRKVLNRYFQ